VGVSGLNLTNDFQKFCGSELDRIQFLQIKTGLGQKKFAVRSSLLGKVSPIFPTALFE